MDPKLIVEAALLCAGQPLGVEGLQALFEQQERPSRDEIGALIDTLRQEWAGRGVELVQVGSGYRFQVTQALAPWISRLWEERRPRYSRALMETLALIAYRQPITRAEIEDVRGVAVSTGIIKTLQDREWIRVVGHRDVPGHPALYGTTRDFLDQFNIKSLNELPPLAEIGDVEQLQVDIDLANDHDAGGGEEQAADEDAAVPAAFEAREGDEGPGGEADAADGHETLERPLPASNG